MTAIRFPILLSLGLHGLAVGVLSLVPFGTKAVFETRHEIMVELVVPARPPIVEAVLAPASSEPPPSVQKAQRVQRRAMRQPVSRPLSRKGRVSRESQKKLPEATPSMTDSVHPLQPSVEKPPSRSEPIPAFVESIHPLQPLVEQPLSRSEPIPAFMEVPRNFSVTASTTNKTLDPGPGSEPEVGASVVSLPETGILPPLKRPVFQTTSISGHLLRDPTPDTADRRHSKVKLGDNLRPEYPRPAREAGWEGTVMLRVEVLSDGNAGSVAVHKSSGHSILDEAAMTAVQRWQFTPAMDGNFPIRSVVHLPVKFDLRAPY